MSITIGDIIGYVRADSSRLSGDLDKAEGQAKSWASGLGGAMKGLIGGAVVGGIAAVGAGIVGLGVSAVSTGNDFANATRNIQSELGLTAQEAERLGDVAQRVWGNNFADNAEDAAQAVGLVRQQLGDMPDDALQATTEDAFRLRDAFGVEVSGGVDAAKTLMENFGLTADEAFDMLASGYQRGLDRSGDFLDTVGEYSTQFASGGASAEEFFNLLDSGLQGGMLGTDKAADAFKEFRVRIQDGSKLTAESLNAIGLSSEEMLAQLASGEMTAAEAFDQVLGALGEVDDKNLQMQAGVGLLGTQFEDLGTDAALGLSMAAGAFGDVEGAIDKVDARYNSFGSMATGMWRQLVIAMQPAVDRLLELANNVMPYVQLAFDWLATQLPIWIDTALAAFDSFWPTIQEGMTVVSGAVQAALPFVQQVFDKIIGFVQSGNGDVLLGVLAGLAALLGGPLVAAIAAFALIWTENLGGIQEKTAAVIKTVKIVIENGLVAIREFWAQNGEQIMAVASTAWNTIKTVIGAAIEGVWWVITNLLVPTFQTVWMWLSENLPIAVQRLSDFWTNTLKPALQTVWSFIVLNLLPILEDVWVWVQDNLPKALQKLADFWNETLLPALQDFWAFVQDDLIPILQKIFEWIGDKLPKALETGRDWFNKIAGAIGSVQSAIESVIGWIDRMIDRLKNIEIPDWLIPGSPPPLYYALRDISRAMGDVGRSAGRMANNLNFGPDPSEALAYSFASLPNRAAPAAPESTTTAIDNSRRVVIEKGAIVVHGGNPLDTERAISRALRATGITP